MTLLWLPICIFLELIKRPIFWVLYPIAYVFRHKYRSWPLDDVIHNESMNIYGKDVEYCWYGKRSAFVEKILPFDFCRSWYWGAWRNNGMNLVCKLEDMVGPMIIVRKYIKLWGKSKYEEREFKCGRLPYLELWFGAYRLQCGFISAGRFQVQFRTYP